MSDEPLPTPPAISQEAGNVEEDGEDEDLFADDYLRDYQARPTQDAYDMEGIDDSSNPRQYREVGVEEEKEFEFDDDADRMEDEENEKEVQMLAKQFKRQKRKEEKKVDRPMDQAFVKFLNLKGELDEKTFEYLILQNKLVIFLDEALVQSSVREKFVRFLKTYKPSGKENDHPLYMAQFKRLLADNSQSFFIDFQDFCEDLPYISSMYLDHPKKLQKLLNKFLNEFFFQLYPKYKDIWDKVYLRVIKLPVHMRIGDLRYFHMNHFISLKGIVIRKTKVYTELSKYHVYCRSCRSQYGPYKEVKKWDKCPSCSQRNSMVKRKCEYKNFQKITLQETSQQVSAGRIPQNLNCQLKHDLINSLNPGDEIIVNGILQINEDNFQKRNNLFQMLFMVGSIEKKKNFMKVDMRQILKLQKKNDLKNFLLKSFCPFIYKHEFIKLSLILSLFGAEAKNYRGHFIRGNINVLILGDPGTGKSQFLKYIEKIHPKCIYTTGRGSTGVGLTATVKLDSITKEWTLEGGALVLADQGVCLIDEFDKMSPMDSTSLHEAMEQQTISISKAGIVTTLKARTTVIAVGNPRRGRYYSSMSFSKNCNLARSLLSRFDILIVVRDKIDEDEDKEMADFVLNSHIRYHPVTLETEVAKEKEDAKNGGGGGRITSSKEREEEIKNLIRNYIIHQRDNCHPIIKKDKLKKITDFYVELRKQAKEIPGGMQIAVRHLESIYRIAEAHARMLNHFQVEEGDIDCAISVMLTSFLKSQKMSIRKRLKRKFRNYIKK